MKNMWLMAFVFLWNFSGLCCFNFYGKSRKLDLIPRLEMSCTVPMELKAEEKGETEFKTGDLVYSGKMLFPFCELRYSQKNDEYAKGMAFFTSGLYKKIPIVVKAGNLSSGGLLSKLNSPVLSSSVSPFTLPGGDVSGITCTLPSSSSFSNPETVFFQAGYKGKILSDCFCNLDFVPGEKVCGSFLLKMDFPWKIKTGLAGGGGIFTYDENTSSSWFLPSVYYGKGRHYSGIVQAGIEKTFVKSKLSELFTFGIYENPFGVLQAVYKSEGKITGEHLSGALSVFFNPEKGILTASGKNLDEMLQLKLNVIYKSRFKLFIPWLFSAGFSSYAKLNYDGDEHDWKIAAGIRFSSVFIMFLVTAQINGKLNGRLELQEGKAVTGGRLDLENDSSSFTVKASLYDKRINPSLSGTFSFNPDEENASLSASQKISLNLSPGNRSLLTVSASGTFYQTDGIFKKWSSSLSVSASFNYRKTGISVRISFRNEKEVM